MAERVGNVDAITQVPVTTIRNALRGTMALGFPVNASERPTFYFDKVVEWDKHDREGHPWDWTTAPDSETEKAPVTVLCAYEFFSPLGRQGEFITTVGDFNPTTLLLTMLEEEFAQIQGFSHVTVGPSGRRWWFRYWRPSYGLGGMTVYQVHCVTEDRS